MRSFSDRIILSLFMVKIIKKNHSTSQNHSIFNQVHSNSLGITRKSSKQQKITKNCRYPGKNGLRETYHNHQQTRVWSGVWIFKNFNINEFLIITSSKYQILKLKRMQNQGKILRTFRDDQKRLKSDKNRSLRIKNSESWLWRSLSKIQNRKIVVSHY